MRLILPGGVPSGGWRQGRGKDLGVEGLDLPHHLLVVGVEEEEQDHEHQLEEEADKPDQGKISS